MAFVWGAVLVSGTSHAQILADGLLNYWNLNSSANDSASVYTGATGTTDDNGTVNGTVSFVEGQSAGFGQAANFPGGTGNNITIPDPDGGTNDIDRTGADLSVSAWILLNNRDNDWQAIIAHGEGADYRVALRSGVNPIPLSYAGGGARSDIFTTSTVGVGPGGDGTWHHVVAITEGSTTSLYFDGVLEASGGAGPIAENGQNLLCLGCNPTNGREWNGMIDDVAMWDRALTAQEVASIYDQGVAGNDLSVLLGAEDDDGDGLPNLWEEQYGLDPSDDGTADPRNGADGDPDMDDSTNIQEFRRRTIPNKFDTDEDGLRDGVETDTEEFENENDTGTDPNNPDSDGDDLLDGVEDNGGVFVSAEMTGSDPNFDDTDFDEMPDGYEVENGLDPNIDDTEEDPDMDTLPNIDEFFLGTSPQLDDTDDDGLRDDYETDDQFYESPTETGTDPLDPDTDNDFLLDGYETNLGEDTYEGPTQTGSSPLIGDSDGDGTHDGAEVLSGRDPTVPDGITSGLFRRLVAYWTFDNTLNDVAHSLPGESVVADNGTFTGPAADAFFATESRFGSSALEQNGGAGWVTVPSSVDTLREAENAASVSVWVKVSGFEVDWQAIVAHGEAGQWRLARRDDESTASWAGGGVDVPGAGTGPNIDDGEWHHIATSSDPVAGETKIYIDGVEVGLGGAPVITDVIGGETPDLFIGANPGEPGREWNGLIDDLALWGRALTADEVTEIFNAGVSLGDLLVPREDAIEITEFSFDPEAGTGGGFSITWVSDAASEYDIYFSPDLLSWDSHVALNIDGQAGTTTYTFANPEPMLTSLYVRVEPPRQ